MVNIHNLKFTILTIFTYRSVALSTFKVLYSYHHYPFPELILHLNRSSVSNNPPSSSAHSLWGPPFHFCLGELDYDSGIAQYLSFL